LSTVATAASCNGNTDGAIDLTVSGGNAPLSYSWSSGQNTEDIINAGAGAYGVTVTDNVGCTESANETITQPALLDGGIITTN